MDKAYFYDTEIGRVFITESEEGITGLSLIKAIGMAEEEHYVSEYEIRETELIMEAASQLREYLKGSRKEFDIKLAPRGTLFQIKVWEALMQIPYGETRSYKQIAAAVGNEKASRAVGMANHNNPILCIIPCHRVIGANGALVGYGAGLNMKEWLLDLEKRQTQIHDQE